ncbi:hypothetical protein [Janibacter melonis]|uniref:hypothetical protein n=1 Tax=Janibacter melonis TaxID=262209 RepID=UPI00177B8D70|nr:hypothetical protein [Janibacter melonis]
MRQARNQIAEAVDAHEAERQRTEKAADVTNEALRAFGAEQEAALRDVVVRLAEFIRRNQRHVNESLKLLVDGVEVEVNECGDPGGLGADAVSLLVSLATAGTTGVGAAAGTTAAVTAFGAASTGTSISALSGVAAQNATMAALGGGSLASGGGGMALGATALNFVTVGPALLVGGLLLNGQGEKALTQAKEFVADAKVRQAEVAGMRTTFKGVEQRIGELSDLLHSLVSRAVQAIEALEGIENLEEDGFRPELHAAEFQEAISLTVAVRDVASTAVVDDDGKLNRQTAKMKVKYKEFVNDDK